ncbi:MAG: glutamate formimidoyltransferase [Bacteroidales bacterium]|nr:glutamate formimidoyltransferase [Bacteroidales bacterium]
MKQLIECVPNFSEGNDMGIIKQITDQIESVEGVKLLDVDPGKTTNRTVVTFVGEPKPVIEAAFLAIAKAKELIDMSKHKGEHPRMGATDVCPLVPIANISMEETAKYAHQLAKRVGDELEFPVYLYEFAATQPKRKNLAYVRSGEYEALPQKLTQEEWKPDYGPAKFDPKAGATAISARNFLVAYNFNLNTTSTRRANAIAFDVREAGRVKLDEKGKAVLDENGKKIRIPGTLKSTKAIGWFIEEYGIAQISMNLTDISVTSIHVAFDEVERAARERGIRVTGSELVGLVPKQALIDAGKHFLCKQERSLGIDEKEIIKIAIKSLGLDELKPFNPNERIIEYLLETDQNRPLIKMNLTEFANETASESPAPGGGSISAYMGVLGISLGTMVANLSSHKRGWDKQWEKFSKIAEHGQSIKDKLLHMVDEDTQAFNKIMDAFSLAKSSDEEKQIRHKVIQEATEYATKVPLEVMKLALESMQPIKEMAEFGNPNSVTDAGVGALAARSAVMGAFLNVKINAAGLDDKTLATAIIEEGTLIEEKAKALENEILKIVNDKI